MLRVLPDAAWAFRPAFKDLHTAERKKRVYFPSEPKVRVLFSYLVQTDPMETQPSWLFTETW